jgi:hypothetical protein
LFYRAAVAARSLRGGNAAIGLCFHLHSCCVRKSPFVPGVRAFLHALPTTTQQAVVSYKGWGAGP